MIPSKLNFWRLDQGDVSDPFCDLTDGSVGCSADSYAIRRVHVAWCSSGRHLTSGSGGGGFESWLCQVDVESLGKALLHAFPHPTPV